MRVDKVAAKCISFTQLLITWVGLSPSAPFLEPAQLTEAWHGVTLLNIWGIESCPVGHMVGCQGCGCAGKIQVVRLG